MAIAAPDEISLIIGNEPFALPEAPPLGTINRVVGNGGAPVVSPTGDDLIIWNQMSTSPVPSVTVPLDSGLEFTYGYGNTWFVTGMGSLPTTIVTSYNTRVGAVTSQLSDVGDVMFAKGELIVGTGFGTAQLNNAGTDNSVLISNSGAASGLQWRNPDQVVESGFLYAGALYVGTGVGSGSQLYSTGLPNHVLGITNAGPTNLGWLAPASVVEAGFAYQGALYVGTGTYSGTQLYSTGLPNHVLGITNTGATNLGWLAPDAVVEAGFGYQGALYVGTGAYTGTQLYSTGLPNHVLAITNTGSTNLGWVTPAQIVEAGFGYQGALYVGTGVDTGGQLFSTGIPGDVLTITNTGSFNLGWEPIGGGATSFTPSWTAAVSNPSIGNGSITGFYCLIGKLCLIQICIEIGSTTNGGEGAYTISLPFAGSSSIPEQELSAKLYIGQGTPVPWNIGGFAVISASASYCLPYMPFNSSTSVCGPAQNTNSGGSASGGTPEVSSSVYPFSYPGNLIIYGSYITA